MTKHLERFRVLAWTVTLAAVNQVSCLSLPEDFWVNSFGDILNGALISTFTPIVDVFLTGPISTALGA